MRKAIRYLGDGKFDGLELQSFFQATGRCDDL
jgi:hypothetical protein